MIIDEIKRRIRQAMKDGNSVEKEVLRVALGEIQTTEARGTGAMTEEAVAAVVRKLIKSNEETASLTDDGDRKRTLEQEVVVLRSLLPQGMSIEAIVTALEPLREAIRGSASDGQATGVAMKHLKPMAANASGKDVAEAVRRIRA
jgi:uncharacterized protein